MQIQTFLKFIEGKTLWAEWMRTKYVKKKKKKLVHAHQKPLFLCLEKYSKL